MAKQNKPEVKPAAPLSSASNTSSRVTSSTKAKPMGTFMFGRMNYILLAIGLITMVIGFALMSGGATSDPNVFPKEEIYSFKRITLAPIVILIGFIINLVAIFYKDKSENLSN